MNKKAESKLMMKTIVFTLAVIIVVTILLLFISRFKNNAAIQSEITAKELANRINLASPPEAITLSVDKEVEIAVKNKVKSTSSIFKFDNSKNEVCVKLSEGRATCQSYFNNVDVIGVDLQLGVPNNILKFNIVEKIIK